MKGTNGKKWQILSYDEFFGESSKQNEEINVEEICNKYGIDYSELVPESSKYVTLPPRKKMEKDRDIDNASEPTGTVSSENYVAFPCHLCRKVFTLQSSLTSHLDTHTFYPCAICSTKFGCKEWYYKHMKDCSIPGDKEKGEGTEDKDEDDNITVVGFAVTAESGTERSDIPEEKFNINKSIGIEETKKKCKNMPSSKTKIRRRMNKTRGAGFGVNVTKKEVLKISKVEPDLNSKTRTREPIPPKKSPITYKCKICEKVFKTKKSRKKHKLVTHNPPEQFDYNCTFCKRKFRTNIDKNHHEQIHTSKKHDCAHCPFQFEQLANLKLHLKYHTGERPNLCTTCGMCFHKITSLHVHNKRHRDTRRRSRSRNRVNVFRAKLER